MVTALTEFHHFSPYCDVTGNLGVTGVVLSSSKGGKQPDGSIINTFDFVTTIKDVCDKRQDQWALLVKGKIEYFRGDLCAADCVYHNTCYKNFRTGKKFRTNTQQNKTKGYLLNQRPPNTTQYETFLKVCNYFETVINDQVTLV